jgi:hypothetical protein
MANNYILDNDGIPEDVLLSLRKLFVLVNHQIKYYKDEMEQHENNAQLYITGKPDKTYNELMSKQEEWIWLQNHLTEKWDTLLIN